MLTAADIFPLKIQKLLGIPFAPADRPPRLLSYFANPVLSGTDPGKVLEKASRKANLPVTATETLLRPKEGGAFVKFSHGGNQSILEVEKVLKRYLKEQPIRPWWNPWRRMDANLVRGVPWIEDLFRLPMPRLRVEFIPSETGAEAVELSQEQLYSLFRPFGKLNDIVMQPPDSKVVPKFAYLDYSTIGKAIIAKNCMHGCKSPATMFGLRKRELYMGV